MYVCVCAFVCVQIKLEELDRSEKVSLQRNSNLKELSKSLHQLQSRASLVRNKFAEIMIQRGQDFDDSDIYHEDYISGMQFPCIVYSFIL